MFDVDKREFETKLILDERTATVISASPRDTDNRDHDDHR
jgi:hypothetical protein